jgi:hypothetical protein
MKKNDKVIVILGVVMLVLASIGIYYYDPIMDVEDITISEFEDISGVLKNIPEAISVSDGDPFYPLIATPVAVHYDVEGEQELIPLFVENMEGASDSIVRMKEYLYLFSQEKVDGSKSAKEVSLEFAEKFWQSSDAVLIIEDTQAGYELGVIATPIASYLSIPIIVTDEIDGEVSKVFSNLGVKQTIICGESLDPIGKYLKLETVEEAVDATIQIINDRFIKTRHDRIDYITLTNPIDAFPPEVLDYEVYEFGPEYVGSASMNTQSLPMYMIGNLGNTVTWEFTVPDDYKYALIEFEGYNHELDDVDEFGDSAEFRIDPVKEGEITLGGSTTFSGAAKRDLAGNIIEDKLYLERVLYDCGGETYRITAGGTWTFLDKAQISSRVTIKKLDNPVYEMMGALSSIAPYLTAYHKGLVFGKPDFAFTADDDVLTNRGETSSGYYLPGRNIDLVPMSNRHIFDNIHEPLNELLAKLADLPYGRAVDLEPLTNHYKDHSVHVALVGGVTVLPRYMYENDVMPISDTSFGTQRYLGGGGTQSDNIYANIDPVKYNYDNVAPDVYSDHPNEYPHLENIVGRIVGRDVEDANALILRSMFYDELIEGLSEWKENYGLMFGGGLDFRAPLWVQTLNSLPPFKWIVNLLYTVSGGMLNLMVGPWSRDTGFSRILIKAFEHKIGDNLGFNTETALHEEGMLDGLSHESLDKLKTASLWNRLTFSKSQIAELAGEGNVKGRDVLEKSNFIWLCGHGNIHNIGMESPDLISSGTSLLGTNIWQKIYKNMILPHFVAIFGPGGGFAKVGDYSPRRMADLELGPSFVWAESCFVGRITGVTPEASIGLSILHSGPAALIASTSGSNIPGGYLPEKNFLFDTRLGTQIRYNQWERKAEEDIYLDLHFGSKMYEDMCNHLTSDKTIGEAFRDAKNQYLPEDEDWELWWNPPLGDSGEDAMGYGARIVPKYTTFLQYQLYGDPAFKPYIPINN